MAWGKRHKLASRAIVEGDLDLAAEYLKTDRYQQSFNGQRLTKQLTEALVQRAEHATAQGDLTRAWNDLSTASELVDPKGDDQLSRHKNQLVELTIESADSLLFNGKVTHAVQLVQQLGKRQIMDWRADRIRNVSKFLQKAEELASFGKFTESIEQLEQAKNIQPDLPYLEPKLSAAKQRAIQLKELNAELQSSALKCQWSDVSKCCQKILLIAPKHQIALDAQKHCMTRMKRKTSAGIRVTNVPDKSRVTDSNSFFEIKTHAGASSIGMSGVSGNRSDGAGAEVGEISTESFLMWVDGVGGFLVCAGQVNTIGQAIPQANISIPVQGDLRRRHVRIETVAGQHLIHPLGPVAIDGVEITNPVEIKHEQVISLDQGVKLKYSQPHPLSKSARLDFVSRHRTSPWSDAVLVASQSIILGPNRDNHVFCPTWQSDLILFERNRQWYCRGKEAFEIDGTKFEKEGAISFDSQIVGEDYSLKLEPILVTP